MHGEYSDTECSYAKIANSFTLPLNTSASKRLVVEIWLVFKCSNFNQLGAEDPGILSCAKSQVWTPDDFAKFLHNGNERTNQRLLSAFPVWVYQPTPNDSISLKVKFRNRHHCCTWFFLIAHFFPEEEIFSFLYITSNFCQKISNWTILNFAKS